MEGRSGEREKGGRSLLGVERKERGERKGRRNALEGGVGRVGSLFLGVLAAKADRRSRSGVGIAARSASSRGGLVESVGFRVGLGDVGRAVGRPKKPGALGNATTRATKRARNQKKNTGASGNGARRNRRPSGEERERRGRSACAQSSQLVDQRKNRRIGRFIYA